MSARPVWLTREQRDALHFLALHLFSDNTDKADRMAGSIIDLVEAWDAAPADPIAALIANRNVLYATGMDELRGDLRALGMPGDWPQPKPPPYPADDEGQP